MSRVVRVGGARGREGGLHGGAGQAGGGLGRDGTRRGGGGRLRGGRGDVCGLGGEAAGGGDGGGGSGSGGFLKGGVGAEGGEDVGEEGPVGGHGGGGLYPMVIHLGARAIGAWRWLKVLLKSWRSSTRRYVDLREHHGNQWPRSGVVSARRWSVSISQVYSGLLELISSICGEKKVTEE